MHADSGLYYSTYNGLFLDLPFSKIGETGHKLALFAQNCRRGLDAGIDPETIIYRFWDEYLENADDDTRHDLLFYFVQFIERQVVLFDAVEDALFDETHDVLGAGSLQGLIHRVETGNLKDKFAEKMRTFGLRLVLTAHPTQFYPGKVLGIINDLGGEIKRNNLHGIRQMLMQLGKTPFVNRKRPTPIDEAMSLGWYLEHVFYQTLPEILYRLLQSLNIEVVDFENPQLISLGFWPGGDRDGNPHVRAVTTRAVADLLRQGILRGYYRDIKLLRRRLTFVGVDEKITAIEHRIYATLYQTDSAEKYDAFETLLADLMAARVELIDRHDRLFLEHLDQFILKVRIFGFHFAALDIRQDSGKHAEIWREIGRRYRPEWWAQYEIGDENQRIELLQNRDFQVVAGDFAEDSIAFDAISTLQELTYIQRNNGPAGCHRYIISNCGSALDVFHVLALTPPGANIDIVPLFETVEDLAAAGPIMRKLYTHPWYSRHLSGRGMRQTIMLGFSDGTKDGGYLRANWSIYRAKAELTEISRTYGVTVIFFDGRGGPPGRGGGNNASYYAAHGAEIENHEIHVTIQGQTISSTYGTPSAARYNIERLFCAGLETHIFQTHANELTNADLTLIDELAAAAYAHYLKIKNHPQFLPYLEKMTPLRWYGDTNIASRPTKRNNDAGLRFEDLRAIPFVGAWAQMKQNIPGYYGFGAAVTQLQEEGGKDALHSLYQRSLFFRTLVENSMQSLSKSNFEATRHIARDAEFGAFWRMLYDEFQRSCQVLPALGGQGELLTSNPGSRKSIAIREDIVLPLIVMQQFALMRLQDESLAPDRAELYRKLVLRAMFGIINAARNAA